jgi:Zn-dependent protease
MKWSLHLTDVAGIRIQVHATFLLLLLWIALSYWQLTGSGAAVLSAVLFILALFGCVVLHELGHALTARRFGIGTRSITLLPIGGVASIERTPEDPREEIIIALAGPLVSLAIAGLLWLWLRASGTGVPVEQLDAVEGPFLQRLMLINILLAVFNLVPAFPMDGGRVLRALLSFFLEPLKATQLAAWIGQLMALAFALLGLLFNPFLFLIAIFIWFGATAEAGSAAMKHALHDLVAAQVMLTDFHTLEPEDSLARAVELTLAGSQKDFPVVSGGRVVGVLAQNDLLAALQREGSEAQVGQAMQREFTEIAPAERMERVFDLVQNQPGALLIVSHEGQLAGFINLDNLLELLRIQQATHHPA